MAADNTTTADSCGSDGFTHDGRVVKENIPDDSTRYDHRPSAASKSVEYSETGRVKLSGVQDHENGAQIVGGSNQSSPDALQRAWEAGRDAVANFLSERYPLLKHRVEEIRALRYPGPVAAKEK